MATPLRVEFTNQNTSYRSDQLWITMYAQTGQSVCFGGTQKQIPFSGAGNHSKPYQINNLLLANGIDVYNAVSLRFYLSLGQTLNADALAKAAPSPTNSSDKNYLVRWDVTELTVSKPRNTGDYGDLTTINAYAIPMMIDTFSTLIPGPSGHGLTTARSYQAPAPYVAMQALMNDCKAHNNLAGGVPKDGIVMDGSKFVRLIGPSNGAFGPKAATGGPFPSFSDYLRYVTNFKTNITDVGRGKGHTWNLVAGATSTQLTLTGTIDHIPFSMAVDNDSKVGTSDAMYTLSTMIYQAPGPKSGNPGLHFKVRGKAVPESEVETEFGTATLAEIYHDIFSAYNFGLIGNTQTVKGWNDPTYGHKTLNDMGSAGWVALEAAITNGLVLLKDVPLFALKMTGLTPAYNQWAGLLYQSSPSVYGFPYSDFLQSSTAQYTHQLRNGTPINSWRITALPDP